MLAIQREISPSLDLKRLLFAESISSTVKKMQDLEKLQLNTLTYKERALLSEDVRIQKLLFHNKFVTVSGGGRVPFGQTCLLLILFGSRFVI